MEKSIVRLRQVKKILDNLQNIWIVKKMIKAISFDLDHTLYNRDATWEKILPRFMTRFKKELTEKLSSRQILNALRTSDKNATYNETSWKGMYEELIDEGILKGRVQYEDFYDFIYLFFSPSIVLYPDTLITLAWCKENGYRPSIITNGHVSLQKKKIECMGVKRIVEECLICDLDNGKNCKPKKTPFLQMAGRLGLKPGEILYVGDNPINDISGARGAGMKTAWLNKMDNWLPFVAPADYEISSLWELQRILKTQ